MPSLNLKLGDQDQLCKLDEPAPAHHREDSVFSRRVGSVPLKAVDGSNKVNIGGASGFARGKSLVTSIMEVLVKL